MACEPENGLAAIEPLSMRSFTPRSQEAVVDDDPDRMMTP
jgi:hypothetical protein